MPKRKPRKYPKTVGYKFKARVAEMSLDLPPGMYITPEGQLFTRVNYAKMDHPTHPIGQPCPRCDENK